MHLWKRIYKKDVYVMEKNMNNAYTKELTWEQVRKEVKQINPELFAAIEKVSPDKTHTIYEASYPYGTEILQRAKFYLPNKAGKIVPIDDPSIDMKIQNALSYNMKSNPVMMSLDNALELFLPLGDHIIPFGNLYTKGRLFGAYRILNNLHCSHHAVFIWQMTAGARSVFMLAKISDAEKYKKLRKEFSLCIDKPRGFADHFELFREISEHSNFNKSWNVRVLLFSKSWFEHLGSDTWMPFNNYLLQLVFNNTDYQRNIDFWNVAFPLILGDMRPKPFAAGVAKQLLAVGSGAVSGFAAALDNSAAPISELQRVCVDIYGIDYAPIIMQPTSFQLHKNYRPVYLPLKSYCTLACLSKSRERDNFSNDIYEIRQVLNAYIKGIIYGNFNLERTPFYEVAYKINFEYIHDDMEANWTKKGAILPAFDPTFIASTPYSKMKFPVNSSFFNGCVCISKK